MTLTAWEDTSSFTLTILIRRLWTMRQITSCPSALISVERRKRQWLASCTREKKWDKTLGLSLLWTNGPISTGSWSGQTTPLRFRLITKLRNKVILKNTLSSLCPGWLMTLRLRSPAIGSTRLKLTILRTFNLQISLSDTFLTLTLTSLQTG